MQDDFWFMADPEGDGADKVHTGLFQHVRDLEEEQKAIAKHTLYNAKLSFNRVLPGLVWGSHIPRKGSHAPVNVRHENIIANGLDTAKAFIGKMRPKATPVPRDADYSLEKQAKLLDRWLQQMFRDLKVYAKSQMAFADGCWAPIGALYLDRDDSGIFCERVFPDEIVVDQKECPSDPTPIQVHRRRLVSKVVLKALHPEHEEAIDKAGKDGGYTTYRSPSADYAVLIESWQLPLPGQKFGKYAKVIETATIDYEDYTRDWFPFVFYRWTQLPYGFYGRPLAEEGAPFQLRHNEINSVIQRSQDLMSVPRIFAEKNSQLRVQQLDNDIAKVFSYKRTLPSVATWPAVHPELYQQRADNIARFFEAIGFSRMSAQARLPEGVRLDSSKALREANFKQNERFQPQSVMLEDNYLEIAQRIVDLGIEMHADRKMPEELSARTLEDEIDWKLLGKPGTKYTLELQASSLNNLTPAAREDQLNAWGERGLVTPTEFKALLQHPDLDEQESLWSAGVNDIKATLEEIEDLDAELPQPDPLQNLEFGIPFVHMSYLKRKRQRKMPEEVLQRYRDWLAEADATMQGLAEPAPVADPMAAQAQAMQSANDLTAPVGPDGVPLSALAQMQ